VTPSIGAVYANVHGPSAMPKINPSASGLAHEERHDEHHHDTDHERNRNPDHITRQLDDRLARAIHTARQRSRNDRCPPAPACPSLMRASERLMYSEQPFRGAHDRDAHCGPIEALAAECVDGDLAQGAYHLHVVSQRAVRFDKP
jgi:hypothetical protein